MIYPTLHFNYNNSDYAVIKLVDTNLPDEKASLFSMMFENDQETIIMFMNLLSTFITQAETFYENGWYDGFDDGLESNDDDEKNRGTE